MIEFCKRIFRNTDVPDSTPSQWGETYEQDLAYLATQLRQEKSKGQPVSHKPISVARKEIA